MIFAYLGKAIGDKDDFAKVIFSGVFDDAIEVGAAGGGDADLEDALEGGLECLIAKEIDRLADQVEETWL
jgi:hypothetical protein